MLSGSGNKRLIDGQTQPRQRPEILLIMSKSACHDEDFQSVMTVEHDLGIGLPEFDAYIFARVLMQRNGQDAGAPLCRLRCSAIRPHDDGRAILGIELPQFDENGRALCRTRRMR